MSKLFAISFFLIYIGASSQTSTQLSGKLNDEQTSFLKANYNWNTQKILSFNFLQPIKDYHYKPYEKLRMPSKEWTTFYKKVDSRNVANRFVYSEEKSAKHLIDQYIHFAY